MLGNARRTDEAVASYDVAIARFSEIGDERFVLASRSDLAHALRRGGRLDAAMVLYRETIGGWVRLGHRGAVANQLENMAYVAVEGARTEVAARLLGAAEALRETSRAKMAFDETPELAAHVEELRAATEPATLASWWAAGRALTMAAAVAEAIS